MTTADPANYAAFGANAQSFLYDTLGAAIIDGADYVPGTQRLEFYQEGIGAPTPLVIYDTHVAAGETRRHSYEDALYARLSGDNTRPLVLIGGVGSGKSTVVAYLRRLIRHKSDELSAQFPCNCRPCVHQPMVVDCLGLRAHFSPQEQACEALSQLRLLLYDAILGEWLARGGLALAALPPGHAQTLRRLLLATDIAQWSDADTFDYMPQLHPPELVLARPLLSQTLEISEIAALHAEHQQSMSRLDIALAQITRNVRDSEQLTALLLRFWLRECNPRSPRNLLVIDNIDQFPNRSIDAMLSATDALARRISGLRILTPVRPSSINPDGFAHKPSYMYHYGPNCFAMVHRRLIRHILRLSRPELAMHAFSGRASEAEITCLVGVAYVYATVCAAGAGSAMGTEEGQELHPDHSFLRRIRLPERTVGPLTDIIEAIVGTSGRYATAQLERFFRGAYGDFPLLQQLSTLAQADVQLSITYNRLLSWIMGGSESAHFDAGGLANLYRPTRVGRNPYQPTMANVRVLSALSRRPRMQIRDVTRALARYGIPLEITLESLNHLHDKSRLLVWFSQTSELRSGTTDVDQFVTISEHGRSYLSHLIGDFEYLWFCANGLGGYSGARDASFHVKLAECSRLLSAIGEIDRVQMAFAQCSSGTAGGEGLEGSFGHEMASLLVSYSSFERILRVAHAAARDFQSSYAKDLFEAVRLIAEMILRQQRTYELFYGHNGYLIAYSERLERARSAVEALLAEFPPELLSVPLGALRESWVLGIKQFSTEATSPREIASPHDIWNEVIWGTTLGVFQPSELRARESLATALRPAVGQRLALATMLSSRFPTYRGVVESLSTLVDALAVANDLVSRLGHRGPLTDYLAADSIALAAIREQLVNNSFAVDAVVTIDEMDDCKERANAIMRGFVGLAQRVQAHRSEHLGAYWAF